MSALSASLLCRKLAHLNRASQRRGPGLQAGLAYEPGLAQGCPVASLKTIAEKSARGQVLAESLGPAPLRLRPLLPPSRLLLSLPAWGLTVVLLCSVLYYFVSECILCNRGVCFSSLLAALLALTPKGVMYG